MAQYSTIIHQLGRDLSHIYSEMEQLKRNMSLPQKTQVAIPSIDESKVVQMIESSSLKMRDEFKTEVERVRVSVENTVSVRLEQYVSKLVKDRVEFALQGIRSQLLTDLDLRMEEMKEVLQQEISSNIKVQGVETLDIDALTKEVLVSSDTGSVTGDSDINFGPSKSKKLLKKK